MQHLSHVLELAIFKVREDSVAQVPVLRAGLRETLKNFPGLIEYRAYCPMGDDRTFADLAMWDSLENAQKVAKAFSDGDPRFSDYMDAIESLTFMSHLTPEVR
ncbi:antibiotic biosynthesis monooxygenase [Pseudomonas donghuensis]|uniref:antibiotic biosynthesis monooxygenase n=1 Tax=Pseudomonas donghuensis TaxID=1163398 RepID=UPI0020C1D1B3|nr:antibiotic biosynthesis monooxygenase [Pseudomonas donghuensis]MCP6695895.1 antibiotic biosynthesis monooxygenase [Pseudomonas donghuensis]